MHPIATARMLDTPAHVPRQCIPLLLPCKEVVPNGAQHGRRPRLGQVKLVDRGVAVSAAGRAGGSLPSLNCLAKVAHTRRLP